MLLPLQGCWFSWSQPSSSPLPAAAWWRLSAAALRPCSKGQGVTSLSLAAALANGLTGISDGSMKFRGLAGGGLLTSGKPTASRPGEAPPPLLLVAHPWLLECCWPLSPRLECAAAALELQAEQGSGMWSGARGWAMLVLASLPAHSHPVNP
jgi:hypothetical protein